MAEPAAAAAAAERPATKVDIVLDDRDDNANVSSIVALLNNRLVETVTVSIGRGHPATFPGPKRPLSRRAELALASVLLEHPTLRKLKLLSLKIRNLMILARMLVNRDDRRIKLSLYGCSFESMQGVRLLLTSNKLESLSMGPMNYQNAHNVRRGNQDLAWGLRHNTSLKEFEIRHFFFNVMHQCFDMDVVLAIADLTPRLCSLSCELRGEGDQDANDMLYALATRMAHSCQHSLLQKLKIHGRVVMGENAAQAIGNVLCTMPRLQEFSLEVSHIPPAASALLLCALRNPASSLQGLSIVLNAYHRSPLQNLDGLLEMNPQLTWLYLEGFELGIGAVRALADGLRQHNRLYSLKLVDNMIGYEEATTIANALLSNRSVGCLDLQENLIQAEGIASLAHMLTRNETLTDLDIRHQFESTTDDLRVFLEHLPRMPALKVLHLSWSCRAPTELQDLLMQAVEGNTCIEHIHGVSGPAVFESKVQHLLMLNRAGRRILASDNVPRNDLHGILANNADNLDVLFFFLRQKSDVFFL